MIQEFGELGDRRGKPFDHGGFNINGFEIDSGEGLRRVVPENRHTWVLSIWCEKQRSVPADTCGADLGIV
ncbi:hypothetical protein NC239_31900 [Streptomyces sp. G3]|uniref:Uncharacterized protein n=1 Tax=Streptomyces salinarius TaxID=2762598 RepID=A0ABW8B3J5_9ACTN|nr:hypothetical protein [Streptomyces sp. G3]MCM1942816.1 hypothetical protein [Streptomyces sp. G3]